MIASASPASASNWRAARAAEPAPGRAAGRQAPTIPAPAKARTKLSYKDARELEQLPARIDALTAEIATLQAALADPALYARDPAGFRARSSALETAQASLAAAEDRWLELEALKETFDV